MENRWDAKTYAYRIIVLLSTVLFLYCLLLGLFFVCLFWLFCFGYCLMLFRFCWLCYVFSIRWHWRTSVMYHGIVDMVGCYEIWCMWYVVMICCLSCMGCYVVLKWGQKCWGHEVRQCQGLTVNKAIILVMYHWHCPNIPVPAAHTLQDGVFSGWMS